MTTLSPLDYAVISQALIAGAREMGVKLIRSAYSTILREARDGSAGLMDRHGNTVAQAELIPMQLGPIGETLRACLRRHPAETLKGTPALASFFDGKEFACDQCINANRAKYFARDQAKSHGLQTPAAQDCAAEKFVSLLRANPIPSQAKAEVDSAIKACR